MNRYDDPDSPDYQDTNVGLGMVPERKKKAPAEPVGETPRVDAAKRELYRAKLHGPDVRTIDALQLTLERAIAAESDFLQVHKNCIEARLRAEKAEREVAGLRACLSLVRRVLARDKPMIASRDETLLCKIDAVLDAARQEELKEGK